MATGSAHIRQRKKTSAPITSQPQKTPGPTPASAKPNRLKSPALTPTLAKVIEPAMNPLKDRRRLPASGSD